MLKMKHIITIGGIWFIVLMIVCVMSAKLEVKKIDDCTKQRIRSFNQKDFTWTGIVEQVSQGKYQPKCL